MNIIDAIKQEFPKGHCIGHSGWGKTKERDLFLVADPRTVTGENVIDVLFMYQSRKLESWDPSVGELLADDWCRIELTFDNAMILVRSGFTIKRESWVNKYIKPVDKKESSVSMRYGDLLDPKCIVEVNENSDGATEKQYNASADDEKATDWVVVTGAF